MRVTEKGQVTIPKDIRDHLGISPGSEVEFIAGDNAATLVKVKGSEPDARGFDEWAADVEGTLDLEGMTTDEYMEWIRVPRDDLDRH